MAQRGETTADATIRVTGLLTGQVTDTASAETVDPLTGALGEATLKLAGRMAARRCGSRTGCPGPRLMDDHRRGWEEVS